MSAEDYSDEKRMLDAVNDIENIKLGPRAQLRTKPVLEALEKLRQAIEQDNRWKDSVLQNGTIVRFEKTYPERSDRHGNVRPGGAYRYVAIRMGAAWYLSGAVTRSFDDSAFIAFVGSAPAEIATSWESF